MFPTSGATFSCDGTGYPVPDGLDLAGFAQFLSGIAGITASVEGSTIIVCGCDNPPEFADASGTDLGVECTDCVPHSCIDFTLEVSDDMSLVPLTNWLTQGDEPFDWSSVTLVEGSGITLDEDQDTIGIELAGLPDGDTTVDLTISDGCGGTLACTLTITKGASGGCFPPVCNVLVQQIPTDPDTAVTFAEPVPASGTPPFTITPVSPTPQGGTLVDNNDGTWTYTPPTGAQGVLDDLSYTVANDCGNVTCSSHLTINIQSAASLCEAPVCKDGGSLTVSGADINYDFVVTSWGTEADGTASPVNWPSTTLKSAPIPGITLDNTLTPAALVIDIDTLADGTHTIEWCVSNGCATSTTCTRTVIKEPSVDPEEDVVTIDKTGLTDESDLDGDPRPFAVIGPAPFDVAVPDNGNTASNIVPQVSFAQAVENVFGPGWTVDPTDPCRFTRVGTGQTFAGTVCECSLEPKALNITSNALWYSDDPNQQALIGVGTSDALFTSLNSQCDASDMIVLLLQNDGSSAQFNVWFTLANLYESTDFPGNLAVGGNPAVQCSASVDAAYYASIGDVGVLSDVDSTVYQQFQDAGQGTPGFGTQYTVISASAHTAFNC